MQLKLMNDKYVLQHAQGEATCTVFELTFPCHVRPLEGVISTGSEILGLYLHQHWVAY